jgi:hypothetical protein
MRSSSVSSVSTCDSARPIEFNMDDKTPVEGDAEADELSALGCGGVPDAPDSDGRRATDGAGG